MKILLDTHILLWAIAGDSQLSQEAIKLITDEENELYYSTASVWEVQIKHMAKPDKMKIGGAFLSEKAKELGCRMLPIYDKHVELLETLHRPESAKEHHDPFDRIMLAQAKSEGLFFLTHDNLIKDYNESCVITV